MTKINLISIVNEKFSKTLDHTKLSKIVHFKDIKDLIEKQRKMNNLFGGSSNIALKLSNKFKKY